MVAESGPPRTFAWACATGGRLTVQEKATVRAGIRVGYAEVAVGLARRPFRRARPFGEPASPPDSRLAMLAEQAAAEQGQALAGHGYRTWVLGSVLATLDRVAVDAELFYVTSLLHDAGMARQVLGQDFTIRSAEILIDLFARAGEPDGRGLLAADAAVAHASPGLSAAADPVGFYVQAGAMADLAGLRAWDLPRGVLAGAYREHPAHDVHRIVPDMIRREARDVPDGRFALLKRSGMDRMVELSPTRRYARDRGPDGPKLDLGLEVARQPETAHEPEGLSSVARDLVEPYELLPAHGDVIEAAEFVDLPSRDPALALQHMETALVRADVKHPGVLTPQEFRRLRYLLTFARLTVFEPGAAGRGGTRGRGDVQVGEEIKAFRARVIDTLHGPLREGRDPVQRLQAAKAALEALTEPLETHRRALAENHGGDFSLAELDAEVGSKSLVLVLGGGGGAGYVYLGGLQRLLEENLTPAYMLCTSMGAIVGAVAARAAPIPIEEYIAWAKTVTYRGILGPEPLRRRHGLTGLFSLRFDTFAQEMFRRDNGEPLRMRDLAIPYETVVAGVRRQSFDRLPARFRRSELAALHLGYLPRLRYGIGPSVASRMWQVAAFIDSRVVKPIVIGGDELTAEFNVADAASFSSAIPGVLHHEPRDPRMHALLDELFAQKDIAALVDGGAASNVPAELAWRRIQDGRLGTRNACYLAWDCFQPQWDPKHLWLQPITQAISVQMVRNAPYADQLVRFKPTLSAVTLAASPKAIDRTTGWGRASVEPALPVITRLLEPVWWEGERPPFAEGRPGAGASPVPG